MQAKSERFEMRFSQHTLDSLDAWRSRQSDLPSRAEAIRRLVEAGLSPEPAPPSKRFSDGEKLAIFMLCEIYGRLRLKGEIDPIFVEDALCNGMTWGFGWKYSALFNPYEADETVVAEVVDFLDMWSFIEEAFEKLSPADRKRIESKDFPFNGAFVGFDGNQESEHRSAALFMVDKLERFTRFAKRELNSHWPVVDRYRRMYTAFESLRRNLLGRSLSADELITVLSAGLRS